MALQQDLDRVVAQIQQRWGDHALQTLDTLEADRGSLSTGWPEIDRMLPAGGIPRGAVTMLVGRPTSGAATLALKTLVGAQQQGEITVYIDTLHALDPAYAVDCGLDLSTLLVVRPQPPALGLDIAHDILCRGGIGLIVLDVRTLPGIPRLPAPPSAGTLRRMHVTLPRAAYALLCLASVPHTPLSRALLRHADVHLHVENNNWIYDQGRLSGYTAAVSTVRSRTGPPGQQATLSVPLWRDGSGCIA